MKCPADTSAYAGWLGYAPGESGTPVYCTDGHAWSDGTNSYKDVLCKAASDGSRVYYFDQTALIEVSCDRIEMIFHFF